MYKPACNRIPKINDKRKAEYVFSYPYDKRDTSVFFLPEGFALEQVPTAKEFACNYAVYKRDARFDKETNSLRIVSSLSLRNHIIASK